MSQLHRTNHPMSRESLHILLENKGSYAEISQDHSGRRIYRLFDKKRNPIRNVPLQAITVLAQYGALKKIHVCPDRWQVDLRAMKLMHRNSAIYKIYKADQLKRKKASQI
jgi:hypothetical protein